MPTSINDIAKAAGVSCTTVLRALWDKDRIAPATKARVLKVAAELNYRPNMLARSLVSGRTNIVGLLIGPTDRHFSNLYMNESYRILRRAGFNVLVYLAATGPGSERACVEEMICNRVCGVLGQPTVGSDPESYQQIIDAGIPTVIYDRVLDGVEAHQVIYDQYRISRLGTEHLISLGHRDVVHFAIPGTGHISLERRRGFTDALTEAGLSVDQSNTIDVGFSVADGENAMRGLLGRRKTLPTAIFARHDLAALGAISAALEAGLSVPGDISIMGVGDMPYAEMLLVPLTSVAEPSERLAEAAVRHLLDILEGKPSEPRLHVIRDLWVVPRVSTGPPRCSARRQSALSQVARQASPPAQAPSQPKV